MTPHQLRRAAAVLRAGGIVAYPTEAVWGLGCDPWNPEACLRLLALKGRDPGKGLILLADKESQIWPLCDDLPAKVHARVAASWPGPHTWILPATATVPAWITGRHASFAARVSAHPVAAALAAAAGFPIVSTSANRSGKRPEKNLLGVRRQLGSRIDACLPGETGGMDRPTPIHDALTGIAIRD